MSLSDGTQENKVSLALFEYIHEDLISQEAESIIQEMTWFPIQICKIRSCL